MLELFPFAIDPIPQDIAELIRTRDAARAFEERSQQWSDDHRPSLPHAGPPTPDERAAFNRHSHFWDHAVGWWTQDRRLSRGHVAGQPDIQIFTVDDTTTIRWTNDCNVHPETSLPWNEVADGELRLPRAEFIAEVERFHSALMRAMSKQIRDVRTRGLPPNVELDIDELEDEQAARTCCFVEALKRSEQLRVDWNAARQAIRQVRDQLGE